MKPVAARVVIADVTIAGAASVALEHVPVSKPRVVSWGFGPSP